MPIGPTVRRLFGRHERRVANAYRAAFIDLDRWAERVRTWVPEATRILEVGCGEGAMTEKLCATYSTAAIIAIDVTPRVGRLFSGDRSRVQFSQSPVENVAAREPGSFDLVLLSDVLHHVPVAQRRGLLTSIKQSLSPTAHFVFKEWAWSFTPAHWACEASDRFLTGDQVSYETEAQLRRLVHEVFGERALIDEDRISPWRNNFAMLIRPGGRPPGDGGR